MRDAKGPSKGLMATSPMSEAQALNSVTVPGPLQCARVNTNINILEPTITCKQATGEAGNWTKTTASSRIKSLPNEE